jgi:hypothetical protein
MKSFIFLLIVLLTSAAFTQTPNWTTVKETNINYGSALSFDVFTNSYGNHVIIQENNALKYYKMNINGQAGSPVTLESTSVESPSITGDGTRIYVVYRKSAENYIRTKFSSDGGASWSYISNLNYNARLMECVFSNNRLHVTYELSNVVYYSRYLQGQGWTSPATVSTNETGTAPRIAAWKDADEDKVYFIYRNSITTGKFREYNVTSNQWGSIYSGYSLNPSNLFASWPAGFTVGNDRIYYYYSYTTSSPYQIYFQYRILTKTGGLISESYPEPNETFRIHTTTTFDGTSYTAFWFNFYLDRDYEPGLYRAKNLGTQFYSFDQIYWNTNQQPVYYPPVNISSAGNETHIVWKDNLGNNNGNNLRYRWDNQNPIAPQNLTLESYNDHPKLIWIKNPEMDIDFYRIYKKKNTPDFTLYATVPNYQQEYIDNEEDVCDPPPGFQCTETDIAYYKISAVDLANKVSQYSNEVEAVVVGSPPDKIGVKSTSVEIYNYELSQNFPNPFNPTTSIYYQIKEKGFVSLKIFDMLGREVANLVDETQETGQYTVVFNASNLPSGVYVYSLKVNDFVQNNKMTLLK